MNYIVAEAAAPVNPPCPIDRKALHLAISRLIRLAVKHPTMRIGHIRVLECLRGYCWTKNQAWPSQARIAEQIRMSDRTVRKCVKDLDAWGFLKVTQLGRKQTNRYSFRLHNFIAPDIAVSRSLDRKQTSAPKEPTSVLRTSVGDKSSTTRDAAVFTNFFGRLRALDVSATMATRIASDDPEYVGRMLDAAEARAGAGQVKCAPKLIVWTWQRREQISAPHTVRKEPTPGYCRKISDADLYGTDLVGLQLAREATSRRTQLTPAGVA